MHWSSCHRLSVLLANPSDLKELILRQLHSTLLYLNRRPYNDPWRWLSLKTGMNLI